MKDLLYVFMLIIIFTIFVYIQIRLSRSKNKYLGFILPLFSFLLSFTTVIGSVTNEEIVNGLVETTETIYNTGPVEIFFALLIPNIPTMILIGVYLIERNKIKEDLDK